MVASVHHCVILDITPGRLEVTALDASGAPIDGFRILRDLPRPELAGVRGDADLSGGLEIVDAVLTLEYLFTGGGLPCPLAADASANGLPLTVTDPIYTLLHLFARGAPPTAPYPDCGPFPRADDAFCLEPGC